MSPNQQKRQPDYFMRTIQMAAIIGGCVYGGMQADKGIGTKFPIFTLSLSLIGVAIAIYILVRDNK
jgi:hypothetical protein